MQKPTVKKQPLKPGAAAVKGKVVVGGVSQIKN